MFHAETYAKLISTVRDVKLTQHDDEIFASFNEMFPEIDVRDLGKDGKDHFKNDASKAKWQQFIEKWQHIINDATYGSTIKSKDYLRTYN